MKNILLLFAIFLSLSVKSQFCKRDYLESTCTYPISQKEDIFRKVDTFLYLISIKDSSYKKKIDPEDIKNWVNPFEEILNYTSMNKWYKPTIIGIMDYQKNGYIVKIQYNLYLDTITSLLGIYNLVVKYDSLEKDYKFKDYRSFYIPSYLETYIQGNITYYSRNKNKLNYKVCNEFDEYNNKISKVFEVSPKKISYFSLRNSTELLNIFGWDIVLNMFYTPTGGFAKHGGKNTPFENTLYSGNNEERYDHELIHLYYNYLLENDTNSSTLIISEGIPTYFGGSSGQTYIQLKTTLRGYLETADSIKIENHYIDRDVNIQIDKNTNYIYAMGAFITELYYSKKGLEGLKELANYTDNNFIKNVSKFFKIKESELDNFLRKELKKL